MVENEYVLGENVTQAARGNDRRGTSVLSVRLSNDEVARLELLGLASGKTVSQIVREAISAYDVRLHHVTWTLPNGTVVGSGAPQYVTFGYSISEQEPPEDISIGLDVENASRV